MPIEQIGALRLNEFLSLKDRKELSAALNTLLASPTFSSWRVGTPLDPTAWFEKCQFLPTAPLDPAHSVGQLARRKAEAKTRAAEVRDEQDSYGDHLCTSPIEDLFCGCPEGCQN